MLCKERHAQHIELVQRIAEGQTVDGAALQMGLTKRQAEMRLRTLRDRLRFGRTPQIVAVLVATGYVSVELPA